MQEVISQYLLNFNLVRKYNKVGYNYFNNPPEYTQPDYKVYFEMRIGDFTLGFNYGYIPQEQHSYSGVEYPLGIGKL